MKRRGDAIILVLGLLAVFMAAALAWLFLARTGARVAQYGLDEVKAREIAGAGVAEAVLRLNRDDPAIVHYGQEWHRHFRGDEVDNSGDGAPDSRWFATPIGGGVAGRYAVLVEDESSKININAAGNIMDDGRHRVDRGARPYEIRLENLPGLNPDLAAAICRRRYGPDGSPGLTGHPDDFDPDRPAGDDRPFLSPADLLSVPGIGPVTYDLLKSLVTVFSYDLNIDGRLEERVSLDGGSLEEIKSGLKRSGFECEETITQVAANIIDFFDGDDVPTVAVSPSGRHYHGLEATPYLNEIEAAPDLDISYRGKLIYLWLGRGEFVELFNPYDRPLEIGGARIDIGPETVIIRRGAVIPARGYYTIGDALALRLVLKVVVISGIPVPVPVAVIPQPIREPPGCDQYHPFLFLSPVGARTVLSDPAGNVIEESNYGANFWGNTTRQKNDPRMRGPGDWFTGRATPGGQNSVFAPETGLETCRERWPAHFHIRNEPALTVGQLGRVHRGEQWRTINLWRGDAADLMTQDVFTASEPVERPVFGRINVNTAPEEVLVCLPYLGEAEAHAIVTGRPYAHPGEIAPRLDAVSRRTGRWGYGPQDHAGDGFPGSDWNREFLFSCNSSLVTVRSNVFRITVTGQVFRDPGESGTIREEDVLAERRVTAVYDRGGRRGRYLSWKEE